MAVITKHNSMDVPFKSAIAEKNGIITVPWQGFFRAVYERLNPLGIERSARIVGHATNVYDIEGMLFDQQSQNAAIVDYLIQRISKDDPETTPAVEGEEEIEFGTLYVYYKPTAQMWVLDRTVHTGSSTTTLSINATTGQAKYQAQPLDGISVVEKITWRSRTFSAKLRGNY